MPDDGLERHEVTYREARAVLEAQRETISDVDEKAVRTVRITVVLIGILVSSWKIESSLFEPVFAGFGGCVLLGSLVVGTLTYSESDIYLGPSRSYIEQLADGDFDGQHWERDLLYSFGAWVTDNNREIQVCSQLLLFAQILLLCGITSIGLAILL